MLEVEADHRRHAIMAHTITDLKYHAGLAHLPSGQFTTNSAWLAVVGIAYNLAPGPPTPPASAASPPIPCG